MEINPLSTIFLISEDTDRRMKFKAFLTENGVNLLEKRFLPALDKMGKVRHLFLTREKAYFLHNLLSGEGIQCVAQFHKETLFDDYRISTGSAANCFQIKLVKKLPPNCTRAMPFLTFETKGYKSAVIQDVPISKPLSRAQVLELQTALDMAQDLPPTLVQTRSERAISRGDAQSVQVSVKQFSKSLQCHLAKPDCAFYGIAPQVACLTVIFQFFIPGVDARFWLSLFYDQGLCSINFTTTRISPRNASSPEVPAHTDRSEYAVCFPGANPPTLKSEIGVLGMFATNLMASF
ncbi:hypothetical protein CUMW_259330 [Citrus unshiu]|uniref:Uncharacterized protein n=1 Tax=Citrus unshiu TaxID=55188 RepID=A0A2H5QT55_CITUN|nr:hypothetical protein CUMW_259330 [Citrus unshiu]